MGGFGGVCFLCIRGKEGAGECDGLRSFDGWVWGGFGVAVFRDGWMRFWISCGDVEYQFGSFLGMCAVIQPVISMQEWAISRFEGVLACYTTVFSNLGA